MACHRFQFGCLLIALAGAAGAQTPAAVWGPEAGLRSGETCVVRAGAATAAALAWDWSVLEPDGGTVVADGDGRAIYTAPFVVRPRSFTVCATVASDRSTSATLAIRVHRHRALELLDEVLGPGWDGPRLEPLAGFGGLSLGEDGQPPAVPGFLPGALAFADLPGTGRRWLFLDQRSNTLKTVTEDGRMATFAGREQRFPVPWGPLADLEAVTGGFELKGPPGSLDGPRGEARFCGPLALAVQPASGSRPFRILVTEVGSSAIRVVDRHGTVGTLAAALDPAGRSRRLTVFRRPWGLAADRLGNVYVADGLLRGLFRIDPDGRAAPLLDHDQRPCAGEFRHLALDEARGILYAADGPAVFRLDLRDGRMSRLASHAQGPAAQALVRAGLGSRLGASADCGLGAGLGPVSALAVSRGLLFIAEETGAIRVHDPDSGCIRLLIRPGPRSFSSQAHAPDLKPRFGPLGGQPGAFPGVALALAFNDQGIGLVGSPDCLAELVLGEESLGGWRCPWGPAAAAKAAGGDRGMLEGSRKDPLEALD